MNTMLYPELYKSLESVRWDMEKDIPWDKFDASLLTDEQAATIKMNAITEWSALPATEMFLRDNHHDSDFSAFMSVWFFEEQKHSLVLMEYLRRFKPEMCPTEEELHAVRFEFDPAPPLETLMLHFCGEIRLNHWYRRAAEWHTEPVIKAIYETISRDEARHGGAYLRYMKKAMVQTGDIARAAFANHVPRYSARKARLERFAVRKASSSGFPCGPASKARLSGGTMSICTVTPRFWVLILIVPSFWRCCLPSRAASVRRSPV